MSEENVNKDLGVTLNEVKCLATEIKDKIVQQYSKRGNVFTDEDTVKVDGLISKCAGALSLLLLANGFPNEVDLGDSWKIVLDESNDVLKYVKKFGYDATPFIARDATERFQMPQTFPYVDSMSWVLSLMLHLRLAQQKERVELGAEQSTAIREMIRDTLKGLCDAALPTGGWGFTKHCKLPDLYFSYAVSESLADFGDYVLGETPDIAVEDTDLKEYLQKEGNLVDRVKGAREKTAGWLIDNYVKNLKDDVINPYEESKRDHNLLYYSYFVIDMLIVLSAGNDFFPEKKDEVIQAIEHGIYRSRMAFDEARRDPKWWQEKDPSSLKLTWNHHDTVLSGVASGKLVEPGVVPLSMRCNALYAYYVAQGPDFKMDKLFELLCANRNADGLWDNFGYSLMITERAIESLVDYADYLREYRTEKDAPTAPIQEVAPKPAGLEELFQSVIKERVQEFLVSPEGKDLIASAGAPAERAGLSDSDFLEKLNDAFVVGEAHLRGKDSVGVDPEKPEQFCQIFAEFFSSLFFQGLKDTVGDESKEDFENTHRKDVERQSRQLFIWLAETIQTDSESGISDLLQYLLEAAAAARKAGRI
jgi:hypothetical protein